ncbi:MAG: hypothetical protein NTV49_09910 [Kiritimatiellaeota bacterium]|nr:hypothetical protein [Kiritimatiellota bacterium]
MNRSTSSARIHLAAIVIANLVCMRWCAAGTPPTPESPLQISGIYPHLAMFNNEGECGTGGAVVPWADRLWVISYGPHLPRGSTDKLYEITPDLRQIIRPESIGGTPANRMIHRESNQLFIGPYAIDAHRKVRAIPYTTLFGRHTGLARHLTDPAGKIVFATMEEGIAEVDVKTLAPTVLWADEQIKAGRHANLPGYHGKGFYSAQGRYVYANNGEYGNAARTNPTVPSGVLAEWDGKADQWTVVRRNQFTDVTGPGGIEGSAPDAPLWSIGWDHRSLILMLLDGGKWSGFRLPKATHTYDGAHGWNTEWPRIRDIGEDALLMTMHGAFWKFPRTFSAANTTGIALRSTYLKVIGDFARWGDRVVFGCDDTAKNEFINADSIKGRIAAPGVSQSNLWFVEPARLDACGPVLGRGAVWLKDDVRAGESSEPFLFAGFAQRSLQLSHAGAEAVTVTLEVDAQGNGAWTKLREVSVPAHTGAWTEFAPTERGAWVRLAVNRDCAKMTAFFHYRGEDARTPDAAPIFAGLARPGDTTIRGGLLQTRKKEFKTLRVLAFGNDGPAGCYDLDAHLRLVKADDGEADGADWMAKHVAIPPSPLLVDAASILYVDGQGRRWRLPKGDQSLDESGPIGVGRVCREVCTERNLLNVGGTFYELPADNAGGFIKLRPIATHNRRIHDFASYRGLLVMSGITDAAKDGRIIRSADGKCALWVGALDDLWEFGKARGVGGPWQDSPVKAGVPSDAYLATGYDRKRLTLTCSAAATVHIEADFAGTGDWSDVVKVAVQPNQRLEYKFPDAFGAYWLRLTADQETRATATFTYE